ncbi:hypothetical protein [Flavobacterium gelatinilyticum]|uniref:hypothetical protein n=1 Tax=Flavobacterium gelatinilyticum TaxID=3003260 RepID=UPI0024802E55|nr:hypothetical protein [Flavobacterium gelatinilyticum]
MKRIISYQIGVDVLGFPIYAEHHIYQGVSAPLKNPKIKRNWIRVFLKIVKQH